MLRSSQGFVTRLSLALVGLLWLTGCGYLIRPAGGDREVRRDDLPKVRSVEGDRVYSFLRPDAIPAIDEPRFVDAAAADFMADDELVLGVVHAGTARAYSVWHLDRHEIVNDDIAGTPIAATW